MKLSAFAVCAQHGRNLTGESAEQALVVGSV